MTHKQKSQSTGNWKGKRDKHEKPRNKNGARNNPSWKDHGNKPKRK